MLSKIKGWTAVVIIGGAMVGAEMLSGIPLARKALWGIAVVTAIWAGYQEIVD